MQAVNETHRTTDPMQRTDTVQHPRSRGLHDPAAVEFPVVRSR